MDDVISRSALITELENRMVTAGDPIIKFLFARLIDIVKEQPQAKRLRPDSCNYCRGATYTEIPFRVVTQQNRIHEVQFNFCPHCGREL